MNKHTILQWVMYKCAAIFLIVVFFTLLYFTIFSIPMHDLHSLYIHDEIIVYHGKVIACIGGIPLYIYFIFLSLRVLLSKGVTTPKNRTFIGTVWGTLSLATCILGFIATFIIPISLRFSSYSQCHQEKLNEYYVTDQKICEKIIPKRWFIKTSEDQQSPQNLNKKD